MSSQHAITCSELTIETLEKYVKYVQRPERIPGDSCVTQLLSITHKIYRSFDCSPTTNVKGVFLDISKAFDKVWRDGLLFKLQSYREEGNILRLLKNYLTGRQQKLALSGQTSSWLNVTASVPKGSVLGPLLFLIYINNLPDEIT